MQTDRAAEVIIERNVPRNFILGILDGATYMFGINLVARYTILPKFVSELTDERWVQGLIPMLTQTGWTLPALFIAPVVASWPRRKPLIMLLTLGERLPFLILALLLFFLPTLPATVLLVSFFILYGIQSFSGGATMSAWNDLIARLIPARRWGTFFGLQFGLGSVFGVGSAWLAGRILEDLTFPHNFALLALLCFAAQMISYLFLASYVEPPQEVKPRQGMGAFLSSIGPLIKNNIAFRRYLICRSGIALALVGHSFFTAAALEGFKMSNEQLGLFTGVMLAAQALSHFGLGALADRWGHKQILELATFVGALGMVVAVLAPTIWWFLAVFICVGFAQAGYQISGMTLVFQFSPPHERPTYIGVANTLLAPVSMIGPLLAGLLAEFSGYNVMFICLTVIGIFSLLSLHWGVQVASKSATAPAN